MAQSDGQSLAEKSLWQWARVTDVISATQFRAQRLHDFGEFADTYFVGWGVYVLRRGDGVAAPPQGEKQIATAFVQATGQITCPAFTVSLTIGDEILMVHPGIARIINLGGLPPVTGALAANWQAAEAGIISIGAHNIRNKLHSLVLDINALVGTVTIRLYQQVNGVEQRVYQQTFTVAADGPGLWIVNGTVGIHEILRVTAQSNNAADNGQAIAYDYMLETM